MRADKFGECETVTPRALPARYTVRTFSNSYLSRVYCTYQSRFGRHRIRRRGTKWEAKKSLRPTAVVFHERKLFYLSLSPMQTLAFERARRHINFNENPRDVCNPMASHRDCSQCTHLYTQRVLRKHMPLN